MVFLKGLSLELFVAQRYYAVQSASVCDDTKLSEIISLHSLRVCTQTGHDRPD